MIVELAVLPCTGRTAGDNRAVRMSRVMSQIALVSRAQEATEDEAVLDRHAALIGVMLIVSSTGRA